MENTKQQFVCYHLYKGSKWYIDAETFTSGVEKEDATVFNEGDSIEFMEDVPAFSKMPNQKIHKETV